VSSKGPFLGCGGAVLSSAVRGALVAGPLVGARVTPKPFYWHRFEG
jgi:hypothetical protein